MSEGIHTEDAKTETNKESSALPGHNKMTGRFSKKQWGIMGVVAVILIALLIGIGINHSPAGRLAKQLELGQKYLEEMKYEEAVVAFNNAIEIDPMNADAYLGLVEVYIRTGDFDKAYEYAAKGYELTGDERLQEKMDMIESGNITASNGWVMKQCYYDYEYDLGFLGYVTWTHDMQGRVETTSIYDKNNQLIATGDNQYDENGNLVVKYVGTPIYSFDSHGAVYNSQGEILEEATLELSRYEYEYDAEGRWVGRKIYDELGNLEIRDEYEYDTEGRRIGRRHYDESGNLTSYIESQYDTEGRHIGSRHYNKSGDLTSYTVEKYDGEGNYKGWKEYDSSGNLLSETKYE